MTFEDDTRTRLQPGNRTRGEQRRNTCERIPRPTKKKTVLVA